MVQKEYAFLELNDHISTIPNPEGMSKVGALYCISLTVQEALDMQWELNSLKFTLRMITAFRKEKVPWTDGST